MDLKSVLNEFKAGKSQLGSALGSVNMKFILLPSIFLFALLGCSLGKGSAYEEFIKSEFISSDNFRVKGSNKIRVSQAAVYKTKEQFIAESSFEIKPGELAGFELVDYQVTYTGSYWLETYQVFRSCKKSGCSHKFILVLGIYS